MPRRQVPDRVSTMLTDVHRFVIPLSLAEFTVDALDAAGQRGDEAFVVWGATVSADVVEFRSALIPAQEPHRTRSGLLVTVSGEALFEINKALYARGEILAGQVHSHPTDAYHSDTDDCHSLVTLNGALSVVVPDFARGGLADIGAWAWYRLAGQGRWTDLTRVDKIEILRDEAGG